MQYKDLFLAPEAIFPILRDENDQIIKDIPATGFQIAGTIQGEGKMAGVPVLFLRTAGCNLRCMWSLPNGKVCLCDTPSASFDTQNKERVAIDVVKKIILNNIGNMNHVVISGGEPFIQANALTQLTREIAKEREIHFAVETNGTLYNEGFVNNIDFFSISPKLKNSVPTKEKLEKTKVVLPFEPQHAEKARKNINAIQSIINHCAGNPEKSFQLKFVVQNSKELLEIEEDFLSHLDNWKPDNVVLMPLGSTPEELEQTRMVALEASIQRGWRYSPRLQITYFGGVAGV